MPSTFEQLMDEYEERFDDQFPLMIMQSASEEEIEAEIRKCLEEGHVYDDYDPDCLY